MALSKSSGAIISTVMTWLAFLTTGIFVYALAIKLGGYVREHVDVVLLVTGVLVLLFVIVGKVSKGAVRDRFGRAIPIREKD